MKPIAQPDYTFANAVKRDAGFSLFNLKHRAIAGEIIKIFMDQPDLQSFVAAAAYAK